MAVVSHLEVGQIAVLRHKAWAITAVTATKAASGAQVRRVSLECLSDESLGRKLDVIWEREVEPRILESTSLPEVTGTDKPELFQAFLNALRWSSASLAEGDLLQAPFRGGVQIEDFQLVPLRRAVEMPRVRLLIADDVGLGKTIEAGLIAQELLHSHRVSRILVICPAHLKTKWVEEMADKFGLEFRIIDRDALVKMRREFGPTINPWASFPRLVTSLDYLKQEHPKRLFEELSRFREEERKSAKPWDLLILDEAHNIAPAGTKNYVRDSDRTKLMRTIAEHFEHKLFLTATPHNGYRESFTGMLELLDGLRFSRGADLDKEQLAAVKVRRLKEDIKKPDGTRRFPPRIVLPRSPAQDPGLYVQLPKEEQQIFELLRKYTASRLASTDQRSRRPTEFLLTLLKKRALSSPMALRESLVVHSDTAGVREELEIGEPLFRTFEARAEEDWSDDEERQEAEKAAAASASRLIAPLSGEEKAWLKEMFDIAEQFANENSIKPDAKAQALMGWIRENLQSNGTWGTEKVIIFTEYLDTLHYLEGLFRDAGFGDAVGLIYGGMPEKQREVTHEQFQSAPDRHPIRILLATDAASEGADFQRHCRNLIHYEIPWNPVRLEQRNGRIDRHGQRASEVRVHHFVYSNQEDSEFLNRIVEKVEKIRSDLGSFGAVVADAIRQKALGGAVDVDRIDKNDRAIQAKQDMETPEQPADDVAKAVASLHQARERQGLTDGSQLDLLRRALELEGHQDAVHEKEGGIFILSAVPSSWSECRKFVSNGPIERWLTFDRERAWESDDNIVVHLDHPLMRRAVATFRAQIWRSSTQTNQDLRRVSIETCKGAANPILVGWARLLLLGPSHNRLHEGLIRVAMEATRKGARLLTEQELEGVLAQQRQAFNGDLVNLSGVADQHADDLKKALDARGEEVGKELTAILRARGDAAARQARALITERMAAIRATVKRWEKEDTSPQFRLELEEKDQRKQDLAAHRARLEALDAQRDAEAERERAFFAVAEQRVYPVALQILLPEEAS